MPDRPLVSAEDIPQSVEGFPMSWRTAAMERVPPWFARQPIACRLVDLIIATALRQARAEGYRLVRDDEATVERMAEAIFDSRGGQASSPWARLPETRKALYRYEARAALTAAQGGEDG